MDSFYHQYLYKVIWNYSIAVNLYKFRNLTGKVKFSTNLWWFLK